MKWKKNQNVLSDIKDFVVGERYTSKDGLDYEITKVEKDFVECNLNKVTKRFRKVLYCGVMAAMKFDGPVFYSKKIERGKEDEI